MEFGYCNICKKHLTSYKDYTIKNGKKICYDCINKNTSQKLAEDTDRENLLSYIKKLFQRQVLPESWTLYIEKLRKQGKTYSGIQGTLYYFYELNNNNISYDSMSVLGIVEYAYDEARKYFEELEKINAYNKNFVPKEETLRFGVKVPKAKKTNIDIGDL